MATFQPFLRLPLELRIQIWESAFVDDRILKVRIRLSSRDFRSPSPVPAVTRACQESRKYCSYRKAFAVAGSPRYIWSKFDSDIIQLPGSIMSRLNHISSAERTEIMRLRVELVREDGWDESESFFHFYSHQFRYFPKLEGCDVLVPDGLREWASLIEETYWGTCPQRNVRIVDANTGEWIDERTAGPYADWVDTSGGEGGDYQRIDEYWDEEDEEYVQARYEEMMKMREPLPRIDLNY
ncbi:hypothetical protein IQ07DRAFT_587751 [Pyrenochaeta sp. DS3sAY3a]|nr:hypothetical protein IQ07DRAFT_587751 [Pyrenochaeta sp. DS3sAY3a]